MKISLNALKNYVKISVPDDELFRLIGSRLVEIEGVESLAEKYLGVKIVKVVSCEKIEGTHLSLCQISDGENEVQVVCGAPNVHTGMLTAWITPGSIVPATFGNENFRLSVRKLRGFESNGMLAAADELGFEGADHSGIIEIDPKIAHPGDNFADVFDLNDKILDIENKSLTHRPDCFGLIGFAREVAGILGQKFENPDFLFHEEIFPADLLKNSPISISVESPELCPRYSCAVISAQPEFLDSSKYFSKSDVFLYKAGMRPVSPIVDLTNIIMLETGQPLHAFDYDKFIALGGENSPKISVRLAKTGEKLQLLDDKTIDLTPDDILITSNDTPVALAGAMGGKNTEIDASTTKILLESATFSLYNLRKTQMAHGIFSEAITRFTKGQPAGQTFNVLAEAVKNLNGEVLAVRDFIAKPLTASKITISTPEINALLGSAYTTEKIATCLENVSFSVETEGQNLTIIAPYWRTDIHIKEDIIEEVGRLLGYDNLPLTLPTRTFSEAEIDPILTLKSRLRNILSDRLNANEILTYSFVSEDLLKKVGENPENSYKIVNSISPELQSFRQSLIPSILDKIRDNQKSGFSDFSLYEINQVTQKSLGLTSENVPKMETHLSLVTLGDFYQIKNTLKNLCRSLGFSDFSVSELKSHPYFEPLHSAVLSIGDVQFAIFGEIKQSVLSKFKLSAPISAFDFNLETVFSLPKPAQKSLALSKFPSVSRDLTLKVETSTPFASVEQKISSVLAENSLIFSVLPLSIYTESETSATKNLSFRLVFSNPKKTLDRNEISDIIKKITDCLETDFNAKTV